MQLSSPDDYEGGNIQFLNVVQIKKIIAPRQRGAIVLFDSPHKAPCHESHKRNSQIYCRPGCWVSSGKMMNKNYIER